MSSNNAPVSQTREKVKLAISDFPFNFFPQQQSFQKLIAKLHSFTSPYWHPSKVDTLCKRQAAAGTQQVSQLLIPASAGSYVSLNPTLSFI